MEQPTEKQTLSCRPTKRQMELLLILNPFEFNRTYKDATTLLRISESAAKDRMAKLKKRCLVVYERFRKVKLNMENQLKDCKCGIRILINQDECYGCWRRKDRKKNSKLYEKDWMFPANGVTPNTIGGDFHFKDVNRDFTIDDLPKSQESIKNIEDFVNYDAFLEDFVRGM